MSNDTTNTTKTLHEWTITQKKTVDETGPETINGQTVQVTRKVERDHVTKMALKSATRRELRAAELHYGKEFNRYVTLGFLPRSILVNKHLDLTGGVLSQKERVQSAKLAERHAQLESDMVRCLKEPEEVKAKIRLELAAVRSEMSDINSSNEAVFNHTAEAKAQSSLNNWFIYNLILINKSGKWAPYFEGDTFEAKEEFMWKLEEGDDPFFGLAVDKIATYIQMFNMGASTPEQFKALEEELAKQLEAGKVKKVEEPASEATPDATPEVVAAPVALVEVSP